MCIAWVIASRGTWYSCFAVGLACYSWWLPPPRQLGAMRIVERRKVLISGSDHGDCEGSWPFSGEEPKDTLVDCSWLVWSSSCVGYAAPFSGFGVWCLAREPPSEWIATTRTSLPASKWTSIKNIVSPCLRISLVILWLIDWFHWWLAHSSTRRYNLPSL
jgi:hypothetical protein